MKLTYINLLFLVITISSLQAALLSEKLQTSSSSKIINISKLLEPIDGPNRKYHLGWEVNLETSSITFDIVVQTNGFIGFGISRGGGMNGADIIVGGVYDDGSSYFSDRHGVGNSEPVLDSRQDWELTMVLQNATHTSLRVSRLLNTCDEADDVAITADTMSLIWSYGDTDILQYHGVNRGSYSVNLLDPPMPPFDETNLDTWTITGNATMPPKPTTYWCSMHKSPSSYTTKRHVVGFNTKLDTPASLKHTHHLTVFKCVAPEGVDPDQVFGPLVGLDGGECHVPPEQQVIPLDLCMNIVYVWAVGGKMMSFPENVGYPINENGQTEYFMIEIHYDNPDSLEGVRFESSIEVFNTPHLREQEAAVSIIAHAITFSHVVPPKTDAYVTVGHCSSACTNEVLPAEGINFFNILLHSHMTGRKLKLRQFRNRVELPWPAVDDNYEFDFQQNRPLKEALQVLPGDHLTMECTQSTTDRSNITIAGLSSFEEMCEAIVWYYPATDFSFCQSAYNEMKFIQRFGIEEVVWDSMLTPAIVTAPESMANKTYEEVLNTMVNWTPALIAELEAETRYNNHYQATCGNGWIEQPQQRESINFNWKKPRNFKVGGENVDPPVIGYPDLDYVYEPYNPCMSS